MKIKQRKYLTKKEVLHWLVDNTLIKRFELNRDHFEEQPYYNCHFVYDGRLCWSKEGKFYLDEEIEVKIDTVFDELVIVQTKQFENHENKIVCRVVNKSIKECKKAYHTLLHEVWTMDGNSIGQLIWSKERGLVD
ncbi:hypothetical protein [Macrococcus equi]|uniref:hypothetical protein n=1 Tax=Macrococcus equi TaxID=3395462 RepID=UPI0039BDABA1